MMKMKTIFAVTLITIFAAEALADIAPPRRRCRRVCTTRILEAQEAANLSRTLPGTFEAVGRLEEKVLRAKDGTPEITCSRAIGKDGTVKWEYCELHKEKGEES